MAAVWSDKIFMNHRHPDAGADAGRLYERLEVVLEAEPGIVSFYPGDLPATAEEAAPRAEKVADSDIVLAIIGPNWILPEVPATRVRRIHLPHDNVRVELETAFANGVPVIPVLVNGAQLPGEAALPPSLAPLLTITPVRLGHENYRADVDALIAKMRERLAPVNHFWRRLLIFGLATSALGAAAMALRGSAQQAPPLCPRRLRDRDGRCCPKQQRNENDVCIEDVAAEVEPNHRFTTRDGPINAIAIRADRLRAPIAVTAHENRVARVWNLRVKRQMSPFVGHDLPVRALTLDNNCALTGDASGRLLYWNYETRSVTYRMGGGGPVSALAMVTDGGFALSGHENGDLRLWYLPNKELDTRFPRHRRTVRALDIGDEADSAFTISSGEDGVLMRQNLWNADDWKEIGAENADVLGLAMSPDRRAVVSVDSSGALKRWPLSGAGGAKRVAAHSRSANAVAFTPNGRIITGGADNRLKEWDLHTLEKKREFKGHNRPVTALAVSADGKYLFSGDEGGALLLWEL